MFMFPCIYDSAQHQLLPGSDIIEWCKRQTRAPADKKRWFLYRHKIHGTFVIARWAGEKYGIFTDFLNLGYGLGNFNRAMTEEFLFRLNTPVTADKMAKAITQSGRDHNSELDDKNAAMKDLRLRYSGRKDVWNV